MESLSWIYLCMVIFLLRNISADPTSPPPYTIHHTQVSFDRAMEDCSPGVLTTLTTDQEVADILGLVSKSVSPDQNEFTFWVGLRKVKDECVDPKLPLRGFKWTENGSKESQVSRWTEEPKLTCTALLCAALKGKLDGSTVTRWGLIPVTCRKNYQFICKLSDRLTGGTPEYRESGGKLATPEPELATPEPKPATPEPPTPATPEPPTPATPEPELATPEPKPATPEPPTPATSEPPKPEPRPATQKPKPATPESKLPTQRPKLETDLKPKTGPELQGPDPDPGSEPAQGSDSCPHPFIPEARYLRLDPDNSSRIQVECWSDVQLELHCSGRPAMWRLLDDSLANFTTVCERCKDGFQKDTSGNCVDIDECGDAPCRHACLNTEGSYRCVCSDENGKHYDEDSLACKDTATKGDNGFLTGILIPVLVAVAALVVLVVVVVVTVKCCLMRRSKKRAMKKVEKMAMKSKDEKDSF